MVSRVGKDAAPFAASDSQKRRERRKFAEMLTERLTVIENSCNKQAQLYEMSRIDQHCLFGFIQMMHHSLANFAICSQARSDSIIGAIEALKSEIGRVRVECVSTADNSRTDQQMGKEDCITSRIERLETLIVCSQSSPLRPCVDEVLEQVLKSGQRLTVVHSPADVLCEADCFAPHNADVDEREPKVCALGLPFEKAVERNVGFGSADFAVDASMSSDTSEVEQISSESKRKPLVQKVRRIQRLEQSLPICCNWIIASIGEEIAELRTQNRHDEFEKLMLNRSASFFEACPRRPTVKLSRNEFEEQFGNTHRSNLWSKVCQRYHGGTSDPLSKNIAFLYVMHAIQTAVASEL